MARWTIRDDRTDTSHLSPYQKTVLAAVYGTPEEFKAEVEERFKAEAAERPHVFVAKYGERG